MNDITVIDNFLDYDDQQTVYSLLTSSKVDWFFQESISIDDRKILEASIKNDNNIQDTSGFAFYILNSDTNFVNPSCEDIPKIFSKSIQKHLDLNINKTFRMRAVLMHPTSFDTEKYNMPHIDLFIPNTTLIYYVNDTEGETYIFNEFYDKSFNFDRKTINKKVHPKKNRAVIFNGLRYHTGSISKSNPRILINWNFS